MYRNDTVVHKLKPFESLPLRNSMTQWREGRDFRNFAKSKIRIGPPPLTLYKRGESGSPSFWFLLLSVCSVFVLFEFTVDLSSLAV